MRPLECRITLIVDIIAELPKIGGILSFGIWKSDLNCRKDKSDLRDVFGFNVSAEMCILRTGTNWENVS